MSIEGSEESRLRRDIGRKLDRAECHLSTLQDSIESFREEGNHAFVNNTEGEGRGQWLTTWDVTRTKPFPPSWPILAGEILYQLNSCLDHLAWELAALESAPEEPDRITFPIYKQRGEFWKPGDPKKGEEWRYGSGAWRLQRLPEEARQLVLDVQPYKCGDRSPEHPLWRLFELSNKDKHKALHVASSAVVKQRFKNVEPNDIEILGSGIDNDLPFDESAKRVFWMRVRATGRKPQLSLQNDMTFEEVFGEGSPACVTGAPFFETLRTSYNYVVLEVFNKRFNPLLDAHASGASTEKGYA